MTITLPRCEHCGKQFVPNHKKQKFCSDACRQADWQEKQREAEQQRTEKEMSDWGNPSRRTRSQ